MITQSKESISMASNSKENGKKKKNKSKNRRTQKDQKLVFQINR